MTPEDIFTVTHFADHGARFKTEKQYSLQSLAETIEAESAEAKTLLPWLKLGHFGMLATDKGKSLRHDANVLSITGCEGDYDAEKVPFEDAVMMLREHNIACLVHTSPSHKPGAPRWRVLCPTSRELAPQERYRLVARLNGVLGGVLGPESFTLSQSYLYGHLESTTEYRAVPLGGRCIDEADDLDSIAIGKAGANGSNGSGNGHDTHAFEDTDIEELTRKILSGESLHPSVLSIAGSYAARGESRRACLDYIGLAFTAAHQPRYGGRWDECVKEVEYCYAKEEAKKAPQVSPLPLANLLLDGVEVPATEWAVFNRIPLRQVCLLSGHGAVGKSTIALQLACGHVLGRDWLGSVANYGAALYIDCEDDFSEIWRRIDAVRKFYRVSYKDLVDGGLDVLPMAGLECVMATVNPKSGTVLPTPFYTQVLERAGDLKYINVLIANASNVFAGNEVDRSQVQQFIGMLKRITNASGGSVTLISHSSLAGLSTETGLSGSTQWHNAVRARMWMHAAKPNGVDHQDASDLRVLDFMKNQYGRPDDSVALRWQNGLFLPEAKMTDYEMAAIAAKAETVFMTVLNRCFGEGRYLSDKAKANNYAPKAIASESEATEAKVGRPALEEAMRALFKSGRIRVEPYDKPSRGWTRIKPV